MDFTVHRDTRLSSKPSFTLVTRRRFPVFATGLTS